MDPLSVASSIVGLVSFGTSAIHLGLYGLSGLKVFDDVQYNIEHYGIVHGIPLSIGLFPAGAVIKRIRQHLIGNDLEQVKIFKKSYTESFTMIGVAGAIIAQIAFTGLSLDKIGDTHWTAYASFVVSLIAGCLAVYYSCSMQLTLSGLHGPQEILDWLTKPTLKYSRRPDRPSDSEMESSQLNNPKWQTVRVPSLNAAMMLVAPSQLLSMSLATFLVGLGIYIGFLYTKQLGEVRGKHSALAILIVYIVFTTAFLIMYSYPSGMKALETVLTKGEREALERLDARQNQRRAMTMRRAVADEEQPVQTAFSQFPPASSDAGRVIANGFASVQSSDRVTTALKAAIMTQQDHLNAQRALLDALKGS